MSNSGKFKYYTPLAMLFVSLFLVINLTSYKLVTVGILTFTAGTLIFPLVYICGDILTEVYGYKNTRPIIWTAIVCNILFVLIIELCIALPAAKEWTDQEAYSTILGAVHRIVIAGLFAFFASEFTNAFILSKLKMRTNGKHLWLRLATSSMFALFIDSFVFITIAFLGVVPLYTVMHAGISEYAIKIACIIAATPLLYYITNWIKKEEGMDYYDWNTNFNPFLWFVSRR